MNKFLTSLDKLLIIIIVVIALIGLFMAKYLAREADTVVIKVSRKETMKVPLSSNREFGVEGPLGVTRIEIKDVQVRVTDSPCIRKICVETGWISRSHQHIVCAPNQVVIHLEGGRDEKIDGITE